MPIILGVHNKIGFIDTFLGASTRTAFIIIIIIIRLERGKWDGSRPYNMYILYVRDQWRK